MKERAVEKLLGIRLTTTQRRCFSAVRWMMLDAAHEGLASGRSYVVAVMYIEEALNNRGKIIHYRDHYPSARATKCLGETIRMIISHNPLMMAQTVFSKGKFRILGV